MNFNPRSREGSDTAGYSIIFTFANFNPRSREGSDLTSNNSCSKFDISIHAPAKGATETFRNQWYGSGISIHAPAKGATENKASMIGKILFQSTLPRRERPQICTIFYYDIGISAQYYYIFLNKNNLMNSFKTNFNRFYYIFLVRISLHLHVKLLFAPHNTTLLT